MVSQMMRKSKSGRREMDKIDDFSQYRQLPIGKTEKKQQKSDELFDASPLLHYNGASSGPGVLRVRQSGRNAE